MFTISRSLDMAEAAENSAFSRDSATQLPSNLPPIAEISGSKWCDPMLGIETRNAEAAFPALVKHIAENFDYWVLRSMNAAPDPILRLRTR
jgi:hypothetical protein